jgi:uncharacterized protein (TIGR00369 family)
MTAETEPPNIPRAAKLTLGQRDPTGVNNRFRTLLGYTTKVWREGYGEVEMQIRDDHMNSMGIVHGGVYMSMMDGAFGHAVAWCAVAGNVRSAVTVSMNTTFLASARVGVLVARGRVESQNGRIVAVTGDVVDAAGTLCATGQATFMYLPGNDGRDGVARR